ncbi:hypothetical protein ED733_003067 [Metarhizium rileyi]|uniref:Uncharacterized protein n=1 Tax=Metarhizium rileyi (strain RCEF 4871) TaxID=1649241 RepID=A0A5C6G496_METRR|nr:hypothetical protein ED733_003067 [Metarhizium rileyi]
MELSFTSDEKRFVLAEIIKSSTVNIDILLTFINTNQVDPDWMSMQLPLGRNMNQCMQVVEQMGGPASKRPSTSSQDAPALKAANSGVASDMATFSAVHLLPSASNVPVPILPRPSNVLDQAQVDTLPTQSTTQPKKRGRPSRADKAKKDLRPNLPPHLAPRIQHGTGHRPILPAIPYTPNNLAQPPPMPCHSSVEARQAKKRKLITPVGQSQQANPGPFPTSSAIPSSAT